MDELIQFESLNAAHIVFAAMLWWRGKVFVSGVAEGHFLDWSWPFLTDSNFPACGSTVALCFER